MATVLTEPQTTKIPIKQTKLLINNQWVDSVSGKTFHTINPATGEQICQRRRSRCRGCRSRGQGRPRRVPHQGAVAPDVRLRARQAAQPAGRPDGKTCRRTGALESLDNGKPYTSPKPPIFRCPSPATAITRAGPTRSRAKPSPINGDYFCYTRHEPVGVVGQIIPWNFPLLMQAWKLGAGAGCWQHRRDETGRTDAAHARCASAN